jgi:isopenicillin-N epimerase
VTHEGVSRAALWALDPGIDFLNHGSFGACPREVLDAQARLRARLEAEPVRFFVREAEAMLDAARAALGAFVGADADDLAFVPNATTGVNAVLRSLRFAPGDELVTTDHAYGACRNALDFVAERAGARVVVAAVPFPLAGPGEVVDAVLARVGPRTRLALLDHVTSPTGLVFPIAELVRALEGRGVSVLVDGAHAPGMLPLDVAALGASYYTGNCHKWMCAPKGAGFLWVRRDRQAEVRPLSVSHGATSPRRDVSRFRVEFDWTGTDDPTPYLCVPEAIRVVGALVPGGHPALMEESRRKAIAARCLLCEALGVAPPCPESMMGSLAAVPLPDARTRPVAPLFLDPLQDALFARGVEVPIVSWPGWPKRLVRISAAPYNTPAQFERLGALLAELAGAV